MEKKMHQLLKRLAKEKDEKKRDAIKKQLNFLKQSKEVAK